MRRTLLEHLADGRYHDGDDLCRALQITPRVLWQTLNSLSAIGIVFEAAPARGYCLSEPVELLDRARILGTMEAAAVPPPAGLEILDEIDSTNRYLLEKVRAGLPAGHACLAECQTAGRGRRGRAWASPYGRNVYLSLSWEFHGDARMLSGLGVAYAVAVCRALKAAGLTGIGLKWPNDILWQGCKLGGVLLEVADAKARPCRGVAGVGLNVSLPASAAQSIDQPWTDLRTALAANGGGKCALGGEVSRNQFASSLLAHLLAAMTEFQAVGLASFIEEWRQCDIMPGKTAVLRWPNGHVTGVVEGIDAHGELILSVDGEVQKYCYGEVSLRSAPRAGL